MAQSPLTSPQTQALAAISILEGVLKILRDKGIASDAEVRTLFHERAASWRGAGRAPSVEVAALLSTMAGDGHVIEDDRRSHLAARPAR